jgi:hypothetical protein
MQAAEAEAKRKAEEEAKRKVLGDLQPPTLSFPLCVI